MAGLYNVHAHPELCFSGHRSYAGGAAFYGRCDGFLCFTTYPSNSSKVLWLHQLKLKSRFHYISTVNYLMLFWSVRSIYYPPSPKRMVTL
jgi:hypothetical protein